MAMPLHRSLHRIFPEQPEMVTDALRQVGGIDLPTPSEVFIWDPALSDENPCYERAEVVLVLRWEATEDLFVILATPEKEDFTAAPAWAEAIAYSHAKYASAALILAVCDNEATVDWARRPVVNGLPEIPSQVTYTYVCGPATTPVMAAADLAGQDVMTTVFSALAHSRTHHAEPILRALDEALSALDIKTAKLMAEFVLNALNHLPTKTLWRSLLTVPGHYYKSEYAKQLHAEGRERGFAEGFAQGLEQGRIEQACKAVIQTLKARNFPVSFSELRRINAATDLAQLRTWLSRASMADTTDDLFT